MSWRLQGIGASPGRVMGKVRRADAEIPRVPHRTIAPEEVEQELERFEAAREAALERTRELRERTVERLGEIEAKIFDPQALMLEDPDLVEGTEAYIRENYLSAERAFDWRLLELRSRFLDSAHAMVADRLADLQDIRGRVLQRLQQDDATASEEEVGDVLAYRELTPGVAVDLDPERVTGILTAAGSRASHSAVLARSLGIPTVVGIGNRLQDIEPGVRIILDGASGRIVVDPTEEEIEGFRNTRAQSEKRRARVEELKGLPSETRDGVPVTLQANLDQPGEAEEAARVGAAGVGLFRTEFLVIGRRIIPDEEEQYQAYRRVVEAFPDQEVTLRTFDIGGDKFPIFLQVPPEENPYLGWRAVRVCLDHPELFRNQLRAALRAARHGRMRLLIPFVISADEIRRTRELIRDVRDSLDLDEDELEVPLGVMVETPAAVETVDQLAPHVDFLSLGTNDLTQYVLAVDRNDAQLAGLYEPLHPALFRLYRRLRREADDAGLSVSVCGDLATDPVGLAALLGLGYRKFSLPPASLLEVKEWMRAVDVGELTEVCEGIGGVESAAEIREPLRLYLEGALPPELVPTSRLSKSL
jgi:phosphotransferase system enzyme I (PtsI)